MSQKEKIIKLMGVKLFTSKGQLKKFLKEKLDIRGTYHPDEFALEEDINELISSKTLERKMMPNSKDKKKMVIRVAKK